MRDEGCTLMSNGISHNIDMDYAKDVILTLRNMGTAKTLKGEHFGFRGAGSRSARDASKYVEAEMSRIGLTDVSLESLPVDAWEFRGAWIEVNGLKKIQAASFGGSKGTDGEISGEIVDLGNGRNSDYRGKNVIGKIALVNWNKNHDVGCLLKEAGIQGVAAVVLTTYDSRYGRSDGALQCHDGIFRTTYPPVISISGRDGLAIIDYIKSKGGNGVTATVFSDILFTPRAKGGSGWNVVGYLPGERWGKDDDELVIIGDHTDAWFYGACDNNTGVAAVLVAADALRRHYNDLGVRPKRTMVFIAHEAEEYGIVETFYTWLWGAWYAIAHQHPDWVGRAAAAMFVDIIGFKGHALSLEMTPELEPFVREALEDNRDLLPYGYDFHEPCTLTDLWPYAISGVACVTMTDWSERFLADYYHTQFDDVDVIDFDSLSGAFTTLADMALRVVDSAILPFAFSNTAAKLGDSLDGDGDCGLAQLRDIDDRYDHMIASSLDRLETSSRAFMELTASLEKELKSQADNNRPQKDVNQRLIRIQAALGRSLIAMKASGDSAFPYEQSAIDIANLDRAITALNERDVSPTGLEPALEALSHVGLVGFCRDVSEATYRDAYDLICGKGVASWGICSHLLPAVDVWHEHRHLCELSTSGRPFKEGNHKTVSKLKEIQVSSAFSNLRQSITTMADGLDDANGQIRALISMIREGG
jgi:Iap family predicted aminopeptidase